MSVARLVSLAWQHPIVQGNIRGSPRQVRVAVGVCLGVVLAVDAASLGLTIACGEMFREWTNVPESH
jgi:hypothetical protein